MAKKSWAWNILFFFAYGIGLLVGDVRRLARKIEWGFLRRHFNRKPRTIRALYQLSWGAFRSHSMVKGMSYSLMYGPGKCSITNRLVCWDAPLGIAVWDGESAMLAMAVEIKGDMLCIRQLQGVPGKKLPQELRDWPQRFVGASIRFARLSGLKGVRLYRAHTCSFYWRPEMDIPEGKTRLEVLRAHRQRMRRRYDGTARQMGFAIKKDYGEWLCPSQSARS